MTHPITHIMAEHGIIPAETVGLITATSATAGQFGHPADGGIVSADHSGDANKKVVDLIERMERIVRSEYAHRDVLIHNCDLGQITFGDVRDLCDAARALPATMIQRN